LGLVTVVAGMGSFAALRMTSCRVGAAALRMTNCRVGAL
jgi:hypothetical protein